MSSLKSVLGVATAFVVVTLKLSMCIAQEPVTLPGALQPIDPNANFFKELACWAVAEIDAASKSEYQQAPLDIISGTQQRLSGWSIRLIIRVLDTTRLKGADNQGPCQLQDCARAPRICEVTIWDQPWLGKRTLTNWSCR